MTFFLLLPAILCFLVLGAHYLRDLLGHYPPSLLSLFLVAMCLLTPFLLLIRRRFILRALQFLLLLAAAEWIATALEILRTRLHEHKPFRAAMVILTAVALLNLVAVVLLQLPRLQRVYRPTLKIADNTGGT